MLEGKKGPVRLGMANASLLLFFFFFYLFFIYLLTSNVSSPPGNVGFLFPLNSRALQTTHAQSSSEPVLLSTILSLFGRRDLFVLDFYYKDELYPLLFSSYC